jgi:hypothetical protein
MERIATLILRHTSVKRARMSALFYRFNVYKLRIILPPSHIK